MNNPLQEHFGCPSIFGNMALSGQPNGQPGFFQFGPDLTCFARLSSGLTSRTSRARLHDVAKQIEIRNGVVSLPFDLDEAVSSLRLEAYTGNMTRLETSLGSNVFFRKVYYWTRPIMPLSVRSTLQRIKLRGELDNPFPSWPIDRSVDQLLEKAMAAAIRANGSNPIPFIWFWPEGKQAAFILTHDVEDIGGKAFCTSLMDIDEEFGFKASFQIVPERRYSIEPEFLNQFRARDFEICVHDLNHDGNLYVDYAEFKRRAKLINRYCKEFVTDGFRSGVLYRNLHWYNEFDFAFDMSVPNVAHLDPQGGGCCTVTPYFIGDILEIPVTLTQDYSLFHILHQRSIGLWKQQLSSIFDAHGLASIIVHPDYVSEPDPQRLFREFLAEAREQCQRRDVWAAVPSAVNDWWRKRNKMRLILATNGWTIVGEGSSQARLAYASLKDGELVYSICDPGRWKADFQAVDVSSSVSSSPLTSSTAVLPDQSSERSTGCSSGALSPAETGRRPLRIAMVSYSFYETDNRVLRYASTLAKRGDHVDVFALRGAGKPSEEVLDGVHVHRLQGRILNERNRISYLWRISQFLFRAGLQVSKHDLRERYDLLHVHSVPDFMVLSALLPRLRGTPVILDIHDILPEFYTSKFTGGKKSRLFNLLIGVERFSCRFASHVIIANDIWRERLISRSVPAEKCTVILNSPDRSIFSQPQEVVPQNGRNGRFLMLYPGSLNWHQGLDVAIRAFAKVAQHRPNVEFHIYGDGPCKNALLDLIGELKLEERVKVPPTRSLKEIAQIMSTADLGIVPKRKDNFGNEAFSTKILEFMAVGVPVIVADTMIDKFYFDDSVVKFFQSGDEDDLARRMREMIDNPSDRLRQIESASRFVSTIDWSAKQSDYLSLVDRLAARS
jgi:glycosyltransferase involved in cell wall biosynthesis